MSYYQKIEATKRTDDDSLTARWSIHKDKEKDIERRRLYRKDKKGEEFDQIEGISNKKEKWAIKSRKKKGEEDLKSERQDDFDKHTPKTIFKGFESIDTSKIGGKPRRRTRKKSKKGTKEGSTRRRRTRKKSRKGTKEGKAKRRTRKKSKKGTRGTRKKSKKGTKKRRSVRTGGANKKGCA